MNLPWPQALQHAIKVHDSFSEPLNPTFVADAKATLAMAYTTKATAVILFFFTEDLSKAELRQKIQSEIKGLRAQSIKEKEALHPALYNKVQMALAMRA
eukprot:6490620-Amphidinium_carterae.8